MLVFCYLCSLSTILGLNLCWDFANRFKFGNLVLLALHAWTQLNVRRARS